MTALTMGLGQERANGHKDGEIKKQLDAPPKPRKSSPHLAQDIGNCREQKPYSPRALAPPHPHSMNPKALSSKRITRVRDPAVIYSIGCKPKQNGMRASGQYSGHEAYFIYLNQVRYPVTISITGWKPRHNCRQNATAFLFMVSPSGTN